MSTFTQGVGEERMNVNEDVAESVGVGWRCVGVGCRGVSLRGMADPPN